jgi:hypothetical protein
LVLGESEEITEDNWDIVLQGHWMIKLWVWRVTRLARLDLARSKVQALCGTPFFSGIEFEAKWSNYKIKPLILDSNHSIMSCISRWERDKQRAIHLICTHNPPPYGREFLRGVEKGLVPRVEENWSRDRLVVLFVASDITQSLSLILTLTLTLTSTLITITNWWRNLWCKFFYPRKYPEKAVSEGLCASASFDLCVFSEGWGKNFLISGCSCRHFDIFS